MKLFRKKKSDLPRRRSIENVKKTTSSPNIFKRNRTLAGTSSVNSKSDIGSPRVNARKLSIRRRKIVGVLLLVIIAAVPMYLLISNFTASVSISSDDASVSKPIDSIKYEKAIQNYLDVNPLSRISYFLDESALTAYVSNKLPEVLNISKGDMAGLGKTSFIITMRTPIAGWQINDKQYYVDSKGIPFEQNYFLPPSVQIVDNSGVSLKSGTTAIASNRFLGFVGQVVSLAKANGYTVTQAALPVNTTRELQIRLAQGNQLVKLSINRPAGEQVEDMVTAIKYFTSLGQSPEYIDVRVSGKAFYK
jgi:hypothetical protein